MMTLPRVEITEFHGARESDLYTQLFKQHKVFMYGDITAEAAETVVSQLMYLEGTADDGPIRLYINSNGGEINSGMLIYDVLQAMKKTVDIYCMGKAASMAAVILASGKKGHRHILPHSQTMIHEPLIGSGVGGSATSIKNISNSIMETKKMINGLLAKHTGKTLKEINKATSYDNYMDAKESVAFGLCDDISADVF